MTALPEPNAFGTLMRHLLELLDGDVARVERDLGMTDYRPRFSPIVRALIADGPLSIRDLARAVGVTHSAASQTVAQMARVDLVELQPGSDARQRVVHLTPKTEAMLPAIQAEWSAAVAAMKDLDAELPVPLAEVLTQAVLALQRRSFRQRIVETGLLTAVDGTKAGQPMPGVDG
ncbi:MarR family winged helix-turn-helix transcriptional regulator [Actinopolymorpha alba]|uniref:MarR family winged helix-turn-helix transcriptional regulator n=1 Tax=Actinopolymorpha alba TaxID=533267 RepID=UPI000382D18F|nr:MarR family transcriptional regulator [Actinopolymorpha alba]